MLECKKSSDQHQNSGKKAPKGRDDYEDNTRCRCGRGKYHDASSCGVCDLAYPENWLNR